MGTFQSITVKVLPEVIGRMRAERPGLEVRLTESNLNEELIDLLIDGAVDLAFVVAPINDDRLDAALSHHLRDGLVADAWIPGPRRNERGYALTELGYSLLRALSPLARWHEEHGRSLDEHRRHWDASHPSARRP